MLQMTCTIQWHANWHFVRCMRQHCRLQMSHRQLYWTSGCCLDGQCNLGVAVLLLHYSSSTVVTVLHTTARYVSRLDPHVDIQQVAAPPKQWVQAIPQSQIQDVYDPGGCGLNSTTWHSNSSCTVPTTAPKQLPALPSWHAHMHTFTSAVASCPFSRHS